MQFEAKMLVTVLPYHTDLMFSSLFFSIPDIQQTHTECQYGCSLAVSFSLLELPNSYRIQKDGNQPEVTNPFRDTESLGFRSLKEVVGRWGDEAEEGVVVLALLKENSLPPGFVIPLPPSFLLRG